MMMTGLAELCATAEELVVRLRAMLVALGVGHAGEPTRLCVVFEEILTPVVLLK